MQDSQTQNNPFATAAIVFAAASVLLILFFTLSLPLGALSILFALLSRRGMKMPFRAKAAAIIAALAMTVSTVFTGAAVYRIFTDPAIRARFEQLLDQYLREYSGYSGYPGYDEPFEIDDLPYLNDQGTTGNYI